MPRLQAPSLVVIAAALAAAGPLPVVPAAGSRHAVRNVAPERSASARSDAFPIYYPHATPAASRSAPGAAPGDTPRDLLREFLDLHSAMEYEAASETAQQVAALFPDRPESHYNVACALARSYRIEAAFGALERAIDCGWLDALHLAADPDLEVLRHDPRFAALLDHVERRAPEGVVDEHVRPVSVSDAPAHGGAQVAVFRGRRLVSRLTATAAEAASGGEFIGRVAAAYRAAAEPDGGRGPAEPVVLLCTSRTLARRIAASLLERPGPDGRVLEPASVAFVEPSRPPGARRPQRREAVAAVAPDGESRPSSAVLARQGGAVPDPSAAP